VLFNKWDKSWVKYGSKYCRVTIETDTGITVIREKGPQVNKYILKLPGQVEQLFESFGISVPEAVQQALRIHEVQIDATDSLNLQLAGQMDSLFLLSQTGSYRAKVLGKLSGVNYIDFAIRELNKDKRQTTAEKGSKELEVIELNTQIDKLAPIEAFGEQITTIENRLASLALAEQRVARIAELFRRVTLLKGSWQREVAIQDLLANIDLSSIGQLAQRVDKIKALSSLKGRFVQYDFTYKQIIKQTYLLTQVDLDSISQLEPKVNRVKKLVMLNDKYNAHQGIYKAQNKINNLLTPVDISVIPVLAEKASNLKRVKDLSVRIGKNRKELVSKTDELGRVEQQYQEAKEQYSEMLRLNGTCPTCNQSTVNV
jgi:exonuclease SbcC